jgi:predicted NAD-dependent protein-ADP-ribosyltransferase YbiA (DUF1768 family)
MAETEAPPTNAVEEQEIVQAQTEQIQQQDPYKLPETYDKKKLASINEFFKKRAKNPVGFRYTSGGDLETVEGATIRGSGVGAKAESVTLKRFVPLEPGERQQLEQMRTDTLAEVDEKYQKAQELLTLAWQEYAVSRRMQPVLLANEAVAALDSKRSEIRAAVRNVTAIPNIETRKILLDETYESRKLFWGIKKETFQNEIARLSLYPFKQEYEFGKYVEDELVPSEEEKKEKEEPSLMEHRQRLKDGRISRIFYEGSDLVNGFLSPMFPVEFTYNDTRYFTAYQAYQVERLKELGKNDLAAQVLRTRYTRTMRLLVRKEEGQPADARTLWMGILTAVYQTSQALKQKLLETGTDTLVYADPAKGPSGVGLAEKDTGVLNPMNWKGENLVGVVLETIRTQLREENLKEQPQSENVRESVISEEEQQKAKVGAIINTMRRR